QPARPAAAGWRRTRRCPPSRPAFRSTEREDVAQRSEAELAQQTANLRFGAAEPHVVRAETAPSLRAEAWLVGIDLPRMDVEDRGLPVTPVHAPHAPGEVAVREHAQEAAAAERKVPPENARRADRELEERPAGVGADHVRKARHV